MSHFGKDGYGPKVDTILANPMFWKLAPIDFADLAMACLDQAGVSADDQLVVSRMLEKYDALRARAEEPSDA